MTLLFGGAPQDPTTQGGPPHIDLPTSQNLRDWSKDMAADVVVLDALIADVTAEISELDARRLKLVDDKAKLTKVRAGTALRSQGAANWSTVVKP